MELLKVRGQILVELLNERLEIDGSWISDLAKTEPLEDEKDYYEMIFRDLTDANGRYFAERGTRKIIAVNEECISAIQMLFEREAPNSMIVFMRSSSSLRLASDLGFLARTALYFGISQITINFGSFHHILMEQE